MEKMEIERFFSSAYSSILSVREINRRYDKQMAFHFNSFDFWSYIIDENKMSSIIAYFLNPNCNHGQGTVFLKMFIQNITLPEQRVSNIIRIIDSIENKDIFIITEDYTDKAGENKRIDISINIGNKFHIGIENKIRMDTDDTVNQLRVYNDELNKRSQGNYQLFYLAPKGKKPAQHSITQEELEKHQEFIKLINYQDHFIHIIHLWAINSHSDKVRFFLTDFENYLKKEYKMEDIVMTETDYLAKYAGEDTKNFEIAISVANSIDTIKNYFLQKHFYKLLQELFNSMKLSSAFHDVESIEIDNNLGESNSGFYFKISKWKYFKIGFIFHGNNDYFHYGLCKINKTKEVAQDTAFFNSKIQLDSGLIAPSWVWAKPFTSYVEPYFKWKEKEEPWKEIQNGNLEGKLFQTIMTRTKDLLDILKNEKEI